MFDHLYVVGLFGLHATCSVSMTLLNKTIVQHFDYTWTVLLVQNVGTVLLAFLYPAWRRLLSLTGAAQPTNEGSTRTRGLRTFCGIKVPARPRNRWLLVAQMLIFLVVLFVSLRALLYVSVPLYVVARNCVPAQTAVLERLVNKTAVPPVGVLGLVLTIVGAVVFAGADASNIDPVGLGWAFGLTTSVALASVADKNIVRILADEEGLAPVEVNQQRIALSIPLTVLLAVWLEVLPESLGEKPSAAEAIFLLPFGVALALGCTVFFGFGMGTFNFYLQQVVNAATVQVANISYKLATTVISRVTHPAPVPLASWLGFALSLLGIALYTFKPECRAAARLGVPSPKSKREEEFELAPEEGAVEPTKVGK